MRRVFLVSFLFLLIFGAFSLLGAESVALIYDQGVGQLRFAGGDLRRALQDGGFTVSKVNGDKTIELRIAAGSPSPESFTIRRIGSDRIRITGADAAGAMYGGLNGRIFSF